MEKLRAYRVSQAPCSSDDFLRFFVDKRQEKEKEATDFLNMSEKDIKGETDPTLESLKRILKDAMISQLKGKIPKTDFSLINRLTQEEKERIFTPAIDAIDQLGKIHNAFPITPKDLLTRLIFVDGDTFEAINYAVSNDLISSYAMTTQNRICLINEALLTKEHGEKGIKRDNIVRVVGIHELLHSLEEKQTWIDDDDDDLKQFRSIRRAGITVYSDRLSREAFIGLLRLEEGCVQYFTRAIITLAGLPLGKASSKIYSRELSIVEGIVDHIGSDDPLFQALFTKEGYLTFAKSLNKRYGGHALRNLAEAMGRDYLIMRLAALEEGRIPSYWLTSNFMKGSVRFLSTS